MLPLLLLALEFPGNLPAETQGAETQGAETQGAETQGAETQKNPEVIKIPNPDSFVLCHVKGIFSESGQTVLLFDPIGKDAYDPNKGLIPAPLWSYCHKGNFF